MKRASTLPFVIACLALGGFVAARSSPAPDVAPAFSFAEPGISPDGREIAFASGGDIWSVPASGGDARLLIANDANDRRPLFSPDGSQLAFISTRTGGGDIYVLTFSSASVRRLTWDDGLEQLENWSADGRWLYFSSTSHDIAGMNDVYRVPSTGGTPTPVTQDRYVNEFGAAPSPDGRTVMFSARGIASGQWWRKGSSHIDESELWTVNLSAPPQYTQISALHGRQVWPMWAHDGRSIFYVCDRGGAENIWSRPAAVSGADRMLTAFKDGRVLWPSISADGRTIAFERDFGVWTLDTATGQARSVPISRRGAAATPAPDRVRQTNQFSDLALAPDGRKLAFIARGEVFAASAKDPGDATRVTNTLDLESQPVWAPDSRRLAYVSARGAGSQIYLYDFAANTETALTSGAGVDISPVFSPDGKRMAFLRNRRELHILQLDTKQDRVAATGMYADAIDTPRPAWSPDGTWIALFNIGPKSFTNVDLVPAAVDAAQASGRGPARPVSFLANVYANTLAWSRDGTYLLFDSRQRTEDGQLARVDLTLRTPKFREDLFRDLFTEPKKTTTSPASAGPSAGPDVVTPEPAPTGIKTAPVFEDIRRRLSLLPVGFDVDQVTISPDGKTAVFIATAAGQANLYAYALDELAAERPVARQLTTTAGAKADPQVSPDSKEVYYLEAGRIAIATIDRRESRPLSVTAELTVDFGADKTQVFRQAWTLMRDNFFDAGYNGVDWSAARATFEPRIAAAGTADEMRRLMSLMVGELNSSHLGVTAPGPIAPAVGKLGLRFDGRTYETSGALRIADVVPLGPVALTGGVKAGDDLVSVNGRATGAGINLDELLANTIDRRVALGIRTGPAGPVREVVVRPTNQATEKGLLYRQWVEDNREYVLKVSGGRLGYVHMINMSAAALDQLYVDLDADNHKRDGVVVDIRNNSGGFVNAYAIDVFTRQPYLRMSVRGLPESPARTVLGQRALESPTVLVTNQHSLSDAEDFSEGYRTLKLGSIVGEPTAGWIVYTWDARLFDGTVFRLPRMRVRGADGTDMERHPRPVDLPVTRPIGETLSGKDSQLDEAVRTLLKKLGRAE